MWIVGTFAVAIAAYLFFTRRPANTRAQMLRLVKGAPVDPPLPGFTSLHPATDLEADLKGWRQGQVSGVWYRSPRAHSHLVLIPAPSELVFATLRRGKPVSSSPGVQVYELDGGESLLVLSAESALAVICEAPRTSPEVSAVLASLRTRPQPLSAALAAVREEAVRGWGELEMSRPLTFRGSWAVADLFFDVDLATAISQFESGDETWQMTLVKQLVVLKLSLPGALDEPQAEAPSGFEQRGYERLTVLGAVEADLTGWRADAETSDGARMFVAADGTRLGVKTLPADADLAGVPEIKSPHADLHVYAGKELLIVDGPGGRALVLGFSTNSAARNQVLTSLRPVRIGTTEPGNGSEGIELRLCNDGQLADVLEKRTDDVAFEHLAPGLHLLYIEKSDLRSTVIKVLTRAEVASIGKERFFERMAKLIPPEALEMKGDEVMTNQAFSANAASVVLDPRFFERHRERLGASVLVGLPSFSRVLISKDTPRHRNALTTMLRLSHKVETNPLSTRLYRVQDGAQWSGVDDAN